SQTNGQRSRFLQPARGRGHGTISRQKALHQIFDGARTDEDCLDAGRLRSQDIDVVGVAYIQGFFRRYAGRLKRRLEDRWIRFFAAEDTRIHHHTEVVAESGRLERVLDPPLAVRNDTEEEPRSLQTRERAAGGLRHGTPEVSLLMHPRQAS